MYIRRIHIRNFRSIDDFEAKMKGNLLSIVGQNDVGKSSVMRAIQIFFGKEKMTLDDFPKHREETQPCEIEIHFATSRFEKYQHEGLLKCKLKFERVQEKVVSTSYVFGETRFPSKDDLQNYVQLKTVAKQLGIEVPDRKPNEEKVEALRREVEEKIESLPPMSWNEFSLDPFKDAFPEVIYIPAAQDHTQEQKMTSESSLFGKLFRVGMRQWLKADPESKKALETINQKVQEINEQILRMVEEKFVEQVSLADRLEQEIEPLDVSKGFSFTMHVRDEHGVSTPLKQRGSGVQRGVLVACIRAQSEIQRRISELEGEKASQSSPPVLFMFEEPEAFLHLSAQKDLFYSLKDLASQDNQVIITTHSTMFMDETDLDDLVLLTREQGKTFSMQHLPSEEIKESLGERIKISEVLTGKVCCIVEGASDKYVFERWMKTLGYDPRRHGIHFVSMDGCRNIDYFANISVLLDFNVPFKIILDQDKHGKNHVLEKKAYLERKMPKLKYGGYIHVLEKGELENYFCLDTVAEVLGYQRDWIDEEKYGFDPKEALKEATSRAIQAGAINPRRYREVEHGPEIAARMPAEAIDPEIKAIFDELIAKATGQRKMIEDSRKVVALY